MDDMYSRIKKFAKSPTVDDVAPLAAYGRAVVLPLLEASEKAGGTPDHREAIIAVLSRIDQPIVDIIRTFMTTSRENWARITAFESLEEKAFTDTEDLDCVIGFFGTLRNDPNRRIRDNVPGAIDRTIGIRSKPWETCDRCGRKSQNLRFAWRENKLLCPHCSRW